MRAFWSTRQIPGRARPTSAGKSTGRSPARRRTARRSRYGWPPSVTTGRPAATSTTRVRSPGDVRLSTGCGQPGRPCGLTRQWQQMPAQCIPKLSERAGIVSTSVHQKIAEELGVRERQVQAAVELLDGDLHLPFIARYRKEATGTLDDAQLRTLEERLRYLRDIDERRAAILESIESQGKLDDALRAQIMAADTKSRLEDVYLPYKPKRRTKAQIAREAGLEPLADQLLADPSLDPHAAAEPFVKDDLDAAAALEGARAILVERFAEDADLIGELRERLWSTGRMVARVRAGKEEAGAKFSAYFDFAAPLTRLPSRRVLALYRGEKEEILELTLVPEEEEGEVTSYERAIARRFEVPLSSRWLAESVRWAWRTRIMVRLDLDLRLRLRQEAEDEAVRVFAANLRDLLLAAPAGSRPPLGLDPGFRTGVKVAIVDATGKCVATSTIYPHVPQNKLDLSIGILAG